jgi:hypothetical protein
MVRGVCGRVRAHQFASPGRQNYSRATHSLLSSIRLYLKCIKPTLTCAQLVLCDFEILLRFDTSLGYGLFIGAVFKELY